MSNKIKAWVFPLWNWIRNGFPPKREKKETSQPVFNIIPVFIGSFDDAQIAIVPVVIYVSSEHEEKTIDIT